MKFMIIAKGQKRVPQTLHDLTNITEDKFFLENSFELKTNIKY